MADEKNTTPQQAQQAPAGQTERTFTQQELDAIVGDRLARERQKYADYDQLKQKADQFDAAEQASMTDLQKAQNKATELQAKIDKLEAAASAQSARSKVSSETGVPADLLTGTTEEECKTQAAKLLGWRGDVKKYPAAGGDAGEVQSQTGGGKTRDQFADWFNQLK